jgi:DNA-binding NarL/FixJ family response regulator
MATPINILLIEDSPEIREVLGQSVVASGNMRLIGTADSAEAAIRLIDAGNIDAAVIDLDLRGSSGLAVLAYLARIGNPDRILRVVLTNHATPVFRNRCNSLGADHFLDKSLEFDSAIAILEDFAQSKKSA